MNQTTTLDSPTPGTPDPGTPAPSDRRTFFEGLWLITTLELRQRVRGVGWYVLLGIFVLILALATGLLWMATSAWMNGGGGIFSAIVFFVLLLATLVSPALSGNAINGDRESGTLATTQVTLITTGQLVLGKFLAAWITALAFLAASVPFLLFAVVLGEVSAVTIAVSVLVLAAELGVVAAIGVAASGILTRPLFSIVVTYLVVAALSVGTVISFGLLGAAFSSEVRETRVEIISSSADPETGQPTDVVCSEPMVSTRPVPRFDHVWWLLAANPYVVLADAPPGVFDENGYTRDLFGWISVAVRSAQAAPDLEVENDMCSSYGVNGFGQSYVNPPKPQETYDNAVPSWFVGLAIHLALSTGALYWAWRRTHAPAKRLPTGSRIA